MMLPMVFIIITGNIDLSVASNAGHERLLHGLAVQQWGQYLGGALAAALLLGTLAGLLNGYLISRLKVPAAGGHPGHLCLLPRHGLRLAGRPGGARIPGGFTYLGQGKLPGTPVPFSVVLFVVPGGHLWPGAAQDRLWALSVCHRQQRKCRHLFRRAGRRESKSSSSLLSGFMAALAGLVLAARFGSTRPDIGTGLELAVITATVLGGVDINGGKGTMIGAVLSLLLVGLMRFGMGLLNIQGQVQGIAIGLLLILSILLPNLGAVFCAAGDTTLNRRTSAPGIALARRRGCAFIAVFLLVARRCVLTV